MAFLQKLGCSLRASLAQTLAATQSHIRVSAAPAAGTFIQRFMSADAASAMQQDSTKLFIGGLAWQTDEATLKEAFEAFGEVSEAKVITDRITGRSRGFGFVTFASEAAAEAARAEMDGRDLAGRPIRVDYANIRPPGDSRAPRFVGGWNRRQPGPHGSGGEGYGQN